MEEHFIAAKYRRIKLNENFHLYKFVEVIVNPYYDSDRDMITYFNESGQKQELFYLEDLDLAISDDEFCFDDLMPLETLSALYNDQTALEQYEKDCKAFFRYTHFDPEKEELKLINTNVNEIINSEEDSHFRSYHYEFVTGDNLETNVLLPLPLFDKWVKLANDGDYEKLKNEIFQHKELFKKKQESFDMVENFFSIPKLEETEIQPPQTTEEILNELYSLIGLENVKENVQELITYLTFLNKTKDDLSLESPNLNMFFTGSPGTGKTTVARYVAKLLYSMGYTKKDSFSEITPEKLIAGYVGQTAIKTKDFLSKNKGGVILVDEAYVLSSQSNSFADEALAEILKEMERKDTVFIFAGYKNEMNDFMNMNPGLQSRIGFYTNFDNYNKEELLEMFHNKIKKYKFNITEDASSKVAEVIEQSINNDNFGNGRFIDKLCEKIIFSHANSTFHSNDKEALLTITEDSISDGLAEKLNYSSKRGEKIGFHTKKKTLTQ